MQKTDLLRLISRVKALCPPPTCPQLLASAEWRVALEELYDAVIVGGQINAEVLALIHGDFGELTSACQEIADQRALVFLTGAPARPEELIEALELLRERIGKPRAEASLTDWRDLALRFLDGHTLEVRISGKQHGKLTAGDLRLEGRGGEPTKPWCVLELLADGRGELRADNGRVTKSDVSKIRTALHRAFPSAGGDPVPYCRRLPEHSRGGWKTSFSIYPEADS